MVDYSAMKSCPEKNNLQNFTISPNSKEPIKAVIRHLPPDTPAEYISNNPEDLGFYVINARQLTTNRRAPYGHTHVETLLLFLVTLTRNVKSQEIFKLNSLNHIIIEVESELKLVLHNATTAEILAMSGPTASNPLDVRCVVVATCTGNAPKRRIQNLRRDAAIAP
jgi:hypothetical protein